MEVKFADGFNTTKSFNIRKGTKIGSFQELCRRSFSYQYPDLRGIKGEFGLLIVIDGIILPTNLTFYDIIKNNINGQTGLLFAFGQNEKGLPKRLGEPIILIDKRFYDKNKHIYPLNGWDYLNMTLIE